IKRVWVVFSRALVNVIVIPRIFGDAFQVGAVPAHCVAGFLHQVQQTVAALWVVPVIDLERVQGGLKGGDLGLGGGDASLLAAAGDLGIYDGGQHAEDD